MTKFIQHLNLLYCRSVAFLYRTFIKISKCVVISFNLSKSFKQILNRRVEICRPRLSCSCFESRPKGCKGPRNFRAWAWPVGWFFILRQNISLKWADWQITKWAVAIDKSASLSPRPQLWCWTRDTSFFFLTRGTFGKARKEGRFADRTDVNPAWNGRSYPSLRVMISTTVAWSVCD